MESKLVINHKVKPSGSFNYKNMRDYFMREGRHAIGGLDTTITREDRELEMRRSLKRLEEMVGYYSRTGKYEKRNPEIPMNKGEVSGGCFCQEGLFDSSTLIHALEKSGSHIVRSVVSVQREDAREMHLTSKADFEHLLRQTWEKQVRAWGVIDNKDIRWCAFFHTDNLVNLHCHVVTWDNSGRFGGEGVIPVIPRTRVVKGNERVFEVAHRAYLEEINHERDYLREYLRRSIERECGFPISHERELRMEALRERSESDIAFQKERQIDERIMTCALQEIKTLRPDERNLSYERSRADVKGALDNVTKMLRENITDFDRAYKRYEEIIRNTEKLRGLVDGEFYEQGQWVNPAKAHYRESMDDLHRRLGNGVIHAMEHNLGRERTRSREGHPRYEHTRQNIRELGYDKHTYAQEHFPRAHILQEMSRSKGITRFGRLAEKHYARTMPYTLRCQIGRNIELGRSFKRSGREEQAENLARESARMILSEPMNAQVIEREVNFYQSSAIGEHKGEGRGERAEEIQTRVYGRYEQNLTNHIIREMENDRVDERSLTGERGVELLGDLLRAVRSPSPQAGTTHSGMRHYTHRSHDVNRYRERDLDELYVRRHSYELF